MEQTITYDEIKKLNNGNRWKADRVIEYFIRRDELVHFIGKKSSEEYIIQGKITKNDLKYSEKVFEQPIGIREKVSWLLLVLSLISNIILTVFS